MAVAWVAGTATQSAYDTTSLTITAPAGIADGDTIMVAVMGGASLSAPSGWTKRFETDTFNLDSYIARMALFTKDAVSSADAGASFTFSQASVTFLLTAVCSVFRGAGALSFQGVTTGLVNSWSVTPATATASANGSMIAAFAGTNLPPLFEPASNAVRPTPPASFTITSNTAAFLDCYLAAAYRLVNSGVSNSGPFVFYSADATLPQGAYESDNRLGAITVLLSPSGGAIDGFAASPGPLGQPAVLAQHFERAGRISAPSVLGQAKVVAFHDFSAAVEGRPLVYVVDLVTPSGLVRVPISSWQATLQTEGSNFLQVVIPACEPYLEAINAATRVRVFRRCILANGTAFEYEMASAPLDNVSTARGSINYTATLSGYSEGAVLVSSPPSATARTLQDVRTIFTAPSGLRVRCAVDWLLRPAQIAFVGTSPFVVAFINYYVSDGDQYMDVGERVEPA